MFPTHTKNIFYKKTLHILQKNTVKIMMVINNNTNKTSVKFFFMNSLERKQLWKCVLAVQLYLQIILLCVYDISCLSVQDLSRSRALASAFLWAAACWSVWSCGQRAPCSSYSSPTPCVSPVMLYSSSSAATTLRWQAPPFPTPITGNSSYATF